MASARANFDPLSQPERGVWREQAEAFARSGVPFRGRSVSKATQLIADYADRMVALYRERVSRRQS